MQVEAPSYLIYLFLAAFSFAFGLLLMPVARWLSFRSGAFDLPGGRRKHKGKMPRLGGIMVFFPFMLAAALIFQLIPPDSGDSFLLQGVLIGATLVFIGGLLDDLFDFPWWAQYLVQVIATVIAYRYDVILEAFTNPLNGLEVNLDLVLPLIVPLLTLFWISGMMQTVNWLDGLDGLATGVAIIAAIIFAMHSYRLQQFTVAAFPLALAGACLAFLIFNFSPARIFLGSSGAYLLGFLIATLSLIAPAKIATALLVMVIPILDVAWQIYNRIRQGRSPFQGDRGHLHFRLADSGLPTPLIVIGYYTISATFGLVAIYAPGIWKLIILVALSISTLTIFIWISNREAARKIKHQTE